MANHEDSSLPENFWQKSCDDDKKFAFEQYISTYHNCFKPATSPSPFGGVSSYFRRECIRECRERLEKRTTKDVVAGAAKRNVDDMLEMGLRLLTGIGLKFDDAAAGCVFDEIMKGGYPEAKKAIAASLACQSMQRELLLTPSAGIDIAKVIALAEISAKFGHFSHSCLNLIMLLDRSSERETTKDHLHFLEGTDLLNEYKKYREETGMQRPKARRCATCDIQPEKRSALKECAGPCLPENKPVYCSKKCQKADWRKHRKWCKFDVVESDEEWMTESEQDLFGEDTDEDSEDEPPKRSEDAKKKKKARD